MLNLCIGCIYKPETQGRAAGYMLTYVCNRSRRKVKDSKSRKQDRLSVPHQKEFTELREQYSWSNKVIVMAPRQSLVSLRDKNCGGWNMSGGTWLGVFHSPNPSPKGDKERGPATHVHENARLSAD